MARLTYNAQQTINAETAYTFVNSSPDRLPKVLGDTLENESYTTFLERVFKNASGPWPDFVTGTPANFRGGR